MRHIQNLSEKLDMNIIIGKLKEFSKDAKKTWSTINEVLGRVKNVNDMPKRFISNGNVLSGSLEIAEGFNDFFCKYRS